MIQIAPQMRILVAVEPVDFRKGIDGLAGVCRNVIGTSIEGIHLPGIYSYFETDEVRQ